MLKDTARRLELDSTVAAVRLSDVLFDADRRGFVSFVPLPSNATAFEAAMLFANQMAPFVAVAGPSGWGKTHLLNSVAETLRIESGVPAVVRTAVEWVGQAGKCDSAAPLILDDVQDVLGKVRLRQQFRRLLERRVHTGRPIALALTQERPERTLRSLLPTVHEWSVGLIQAPEVTERILVVRGMASNERLVLAEPLVRLLAQKAPGNGLSLAGALSRLRLLKDRWQEAPAILRACGVLMPFLSDTRGWDLRDHVYDAVVAFWSRSSETLPVGPHEFAIYSMLTLMGLPERDVAAYFQLNQGDAYAIAATVADRQNCGSLGDVVNRWNDEFVNTLERL